MAGSKEPPDILSDKFFKCHPNQRVKFVVCLLCENVYHTSDFEVLKNTKRLSATFVICPEHIKLKLTSKKEENILCNDAKMIIAEIKSLQKVQIKKQIISEIVSESEKSHDETIYEDHTEFETMKIENVILKDLNAELKNNNVLLKELLDNEKKSAIKMNTQNTFAEIVSNVKTNIKPAPKIRIKKNKKEDKISEIKQKISHYLIKDKSIKTRNIEIQNDEIVLKCDNEESVNSAFNLINTKLFKYCKVEKEQILKPKIKIVGIDNFEGMNDKELEEDINRRN